MYALDRRLVDPRRPKKQKLTQEEMEEGLVPYQVRRRTALRGTARLRTARVQAYPWPMLSPQDTLPMQPGSFASLDKQVLGLRGVAVEPTRLESTCLILTYGVDLFYTRISPANGFDSLEADFNYALLVAMLLALGAGSVVMAYLSKQSALAQNWK